MDQEFSEDRIPGNCRRNLTDLIFRHIESTPNMLNEYNEFLAQVGDRSLNASLGMHVRRHFRLENGRDDTPATSTLIKTFTEHYN